MDILFNIDLESGYPDIVQTIKSLEYYIATVRTQNAKIIKVWHGGEETMSRGKYKAPVRAAIRRLKRENRVKFYIYSENFNEKDEATRYMIEKYPLAQMQNSDWGEYTDAYTMLCL